MRKTAYPHIQEMSFCLPGPAGMRNENFVQEINELHADICSALADPTRILILYTLDEQRVSVTELAAFLGISQPAASRHLKVLRERGLVRPERQGSSIRYQLADTRMILILDLLRDVLHERIQHRADLLESFRS
jgi:DNA-binding transcriptional ArsR family regulator